MQANHDVTTFVDQLSRLEQVLSHFPQREAPVTHHFGGGVYTRELFIPAGSLIIGKRHRGETTNLLIKGAISIYMGPDLPVKHITAPSIFISPPFTKKMGYAHEDTIFVNVHPTEETDLDKIEEEFIITEPEYEALLGEGDKISGLLTEQISEPDQTDH